MSRHGGIIKDIELTITVRRAALNDRPMLTELMRRAFREAYAENTRPGDLKAHMETHFNEARQKAELGDPQTITLVAELVDVQVGYAQMNPGPVPKCVTSASPLQLLRFYLLRDYWGSGAADKLMQRCLSEVVSMDYTDLWLSTWEKNKRAQAFYRKWGFRPVGTAPFTVGTDSQTDFILSRPLGSENP